MPTFAITYSVVDAKGKESTTAIDVPLSTSWLDVIAFAPAVALLIDPLLKGKITRIGVTASIALPSGLKSTPAADSDVEEGARFQWRTANGFFKAMRLPSFDEANLLSGTGQVNLADTDVAAFVAAMQAGIDLPGDQPIVAPSDSRGEDLLTSETAFEQFLSTPRRR